MTNEWSPATTNEVKQAIETERVQTDPAYWAELATLLVEPYQVSIERVGGVERAFVVARRAPRVVYFDDVEEIFGTATEADGLLTDCTHFSSLPVGALHKMASQVVLLVYESEVGRKRARQLLAGRLKSEYELEYVNSRRTNIRKVQ
jgi:hypothetical protein